MEDRYNVECCELMCAHKEIVEKVQKEMPDEDTLYDLTELFLSLIHISEPTRP